MMRMFQTLQRRIRLIVSRAVVLIVTDSFSRQNLQVSVLADEVIDGVERFQNYGHTSVPPQESEAILLSVGGKRQHVVAVVVDDKKTRLKNLARGDSALYHLEGHYLLLGKNGQATLICNSLKVEANKAVFDVPETEFTGDVNILKNATIKGISQALDHKSGANSETSGAEHVHYCPHCKTNTSGPR